MNSKQLKVRRLKVYYLHYSNSSKRYPFIRLSGKYLAQSDFRIGDEIEVSINTGNIVITKLPQHEKQNA